MHTCETASASPPHQAKEEGFRLIVLGVTNGDDVGLPRSDGAFEERTANVVGRIFERTMFLTRDSTNVCTLGCERKAEVGGHLCAEAFVSIRFVAKLVIQMRDPNELQFAGVA